MKQLVIILVLVGCTPPTPVVRPPSPAYNFDWHVYDGPVGPRTQQVIVNGERFVVISED